MGNFRIEIEAVGGHGDQRQIKNGGKLDFDHRVVSSVDRVAWEAVRSLKERNAEVISAKIIHWPGQTSEVIDNVLKEERLGSF